jgi:hypothetical protein
MSTRHTFAVIALVGVLATLVRDGKPGPAQRVVIGTASPQQVVLR